MAAYAMMGSYDAHGYMRRYERRAAVPTLSTTPALPAIVSSVATNPCLDDNDPVADKRALLVEQSTDSFHATSGDMVTVTRGPGTFKQFCKRLELHTIFNALTTENAGTALQIKNLPAPEFRELYKRLAAHLEAAKIKIDFSDTTLIMRRPSQTHESGMKGWNALAVLLRSQMDMPPEVWGQIDWQKGQLDVNLPLLSPGGGRMKCPDACLGPVNKGVPTLILETGYSQTRTEVHSVAKSWLWRLIRDGTEALEDHAIQCVILFKVNETLSKRWLPAFRKSQEGQEFHVTQDSSTKPEASSFLPRAALSAIALTVEIWRNETDPITKALKREHTVGNRPTCTIPTCISIHQITVQELFDTWIWEYLAEPRKETLNIFDKVEDQPAIPRSRVSASVENKYFTLYLDDLTSPEHIPHDQRGEIWVNIPMKMWVWGYLVSQGVGFHGWDRKQVPGFGDAWTKWKSRNKENREPNAEMGPEREVLGDLETQNEQHGVKRRKLQDGN